MAKKNKGGKTSKNVNQAENKEKELIIDTQVEDITDKKESTEVKEQKQKDTTVSTNEKKPTQKKEKKEHIPTIIPDESENKPSIAITKKSNIDTPIQQSSVDAKAKLVEYGYHRFVNNQEMKDKYPEQYAACVKNVDMVWLLAMIDTQKELEQRVASGEFVVRVDTKDLMPLQEVASMLGIELATSKALPCNPTDTQLEIDFSKSNIPETLKNEDNVVNIPDLDPKKPRTAEELATVLNYLIRADRNIATSLVNTVEWYRTNRIEQAISADSKLAVDAKSVEELINEIFNIIDVSKLGIFKGLGSTVYMYTKLHNSPVAAHSLLHKHMSKCGWSEADIASACKALVQENFRLKNLENKDSNPLDDEAIKAIMSNIGESYINKVFDYAHMQIDNTTENKNEAEVNKAWANRLIQIVRQSYFAPNYKPSDDELHMKIGQIINLYRDPMDRLEAYRDTEVVGEYPQTKTVEVKKEETENKEESKKN